MADLWSDFEPLRNQVKNNTVDRLKHIANGLNEQCAAQIVKSGKKQDLIDRIVSRMDAWRRNGQTDRWAKAKVILNQVRDTGLYDRMSSYSTSSPSPSTYGPGPQSLNAYATSGTGKLGLNDVSGGSSLSAIPKYDPYAPPRKAVPASPGQATSLGKQSIIRFRPSPFFHVEQSVSNIVECPESTSATDRRSQTITFLLNQDQINKIRLERYQLRLYCTSSMFYFNNPNAFRTSPGPCPIEFPPTCEIRVNGNVINANTKGLKKKPGTAPPAELPLRHLKAELQSLNKVEIIYVNSQQPIQAKKYYLVVLLVETTTVEQLVERLRKGKFRSLSEVKSDIFSTNLEDDEIEYGPQTLSLKCPLSYIRIEIPSRSKHCVHPQCFDARSWYQVMEQTTTWLCPVCEKILNSEDLIVDGLFESILKGTPDELDDVLIEADGEWHSEDNKYASASWRARHPPKVDLPPSKLVSDWTTGEVVKQQAYMPNIVSLCDTDEEDETTVSQELSRTNSSGPKAVSSIIDLTLDSDEEDEYSSFMPTVATSSTSGTASSSGSLKRKADDHGHNGYQEATAAHVSQRPRLVDGSDVNGHSSLNGSSQRYGSSQYYGLHSPLYLSGSASRPTYPVPHGLARSPPPFPFPPSPRGEWQSMG